MTDPAYPGPPPAYSYSGGPPPGGAGGPPPPPGYSQPYGPPQGQYYQGQKRGPPPGHGRVVYTQPVTVVQPPPPGPRPPDFIYLAMFTAFCCNILLGLLAIWMGHRSQQSANYGDYETAKKKGQCALVFSIIGIVLGVATFAGIIVWYCYRLGLIP